MITVGVRGVRAWGKHGVLVREKKTAQPFEADVEVDLDVESAQALSDTLDYRLLVAAVYRIVGGPSYDLIESMAADLCDAVLASDRRVRCCRVELRKPMAALGPGQGSFCRVERQVR